MTSIADLYPEGCKLKHTIFLLIVIVCLAIVPPSFGSTGKDDKSRFDLCK
jgi:hypothetical protein